MSKFNWDDYSDVLDDGFPADHLDPVELNDLKDEPTIDFDAAVYWIGDNKAVVERHPVEKEESRWEGGDNFPEAPDQASWDDITD